jgi:hypothetical protein
MPSRFKDLCLDASDHQALADWWCAALGYVHQAEETPARLLAEWRRSHHPGQAEPDPVLDTGHRADRVRDLLAAPQMPLMEQHVGHPPCAVLCKIAMGLHAHPDA